MRVCFWTLFVCCCFCCKAWAEEELSGLLTPKLTTSLRNSNQANVERIKTWSGEAHVDVEQLERGKRIYRIKSVSRFAFDAEKNALQGTYRVIDMQAEQAVIGGVGWTSGYLDIGHKCFKLQFADNSIGEKQYVSVLPRTAHKRTVGRSQRFDPFEFFAVKRMTPSDYWAIIDIWTADENSTVDCSAIENDEGHIVVTTRNQKFPNRWSEVVIERESGLMLRYETKSDPPDGRGWTRITQFFATINKVQVPKRIEYTSDTDGDSHANFVIRTTFVKQTVNDELPKEALSLPFMGIKSGARIDDTLTGETSRFSSDEG